MATLEDLLRRIEIVRRKERKVILLAGLCKTALALIGAVLAYFLIDWVFDLPYFARLVFAGGGLAAVGHVVNKHLLRELARIRDDDEIALRIEARNPDLRGRLISSLQLNRAQRKGVYAGSAEMISALEEETARMSEPLDFTRVINKDLLTRLGIAAAVIVVTKFALVLKFPDYFAALGGRLVHADGRFPTRTRIQEIKAPEYIARGDDLTVNVLIDPTSEIPAQAGTLHFISAGNSQVSVELAAVGGAVFSGTLSKPIDDVTLTASIGDARSEPRRVRVMPRPEVDVAQSSVQFRLPSYAVVNEKIRKLQQGIEEARTQGGTPEKIKELEDAIKAERVLVAPPPPEKFGGMVALTGSTAEVVLRSTKPLKGAQLKRGDGRDFDFEKKDAQGLLWQASGMAIEKSSSFHVRLRDTDDLENSQPAVEYPIEAKPDLPPTIKLVRPSRDMSVTPKAKLSVIFSARDDYNVRAVWLVHRIQSEGQSAFIGKREELPRMPQVKDLLDAKFTWDLAALDLKERDQIVFWLEADDDCASNDVAPARGVRRPDGPDAAAPPDAPGDKAYTRSADVRLTVVSRADKAAELEAAIERIYEQLKTQTESQEELNRKVMLLLEELQKIKVE